jgi:tRNA G46 methylase TrmB
MNNYYKDNSKEFIESTINCDMKKHYDSFEKYLDKESKTILDIGFGLGLILF